MVEVRELPRTQLEGNVAQADGSQVSGGALILLSIGLGIVGLNAQGTTGLALLGLCGMTYLAGVIRWAVSGARLVQLERIQRQLGELRALLDRSTRTP